MNVRAVVRGTAIGAAVVAGVVLAQQTPLKSGLDLVGFDKAVRPQDDLYRHVNGRWLARTEIPPDRPVYSTFVEVADRTEANLHALIEELAADPHRTSGSTAQQVGDFYAAFMDEKRVNALGAEPLKRWLAEIDAIGDTREFAEVTGRLSVVGVPGPVGSLIDPDAGDPTRVALYLNQRGTALSREHYLGHSSRSADIRTKYVAYLTDIFTLAGRPNAAESAKAVMDLETALAKIQWTPAESRDAVKTYNKYPIRKVIDEMPGFDWSAWAKPQGFDRATEWIIREPSFFQGFAELVPKTPLSTWKAWLAARLITARGMFLSEPFLRTRFAFFNTTLTGQQEPRARWRRGVQLLNGSMSEALGQLYVAKHFSAASRVRMEKMIANLLEAYRQSITNLDWMTPATRQEALAKLAKISVKVGYPSKWRDYGALDVRRNDLIGNIERAKKLEHEHEVGKLGKPVDRDEWLMAPQTVNASYRPVRNEIVFPAAVLQPPFFDLATDDAVNYGAIGAAIGHEIGHAFDDQGRRFDADGKLRDWWTSQDEAEFQRRTRVLVEQFNAFSPLPGVNVNGELTLGENIGDLGGLAIAYRAYKNSLAGKAAPVIDGFTGDQRFFLGYAQCWRAKARDGYLRQQVLTGAHAWSEFRANGPLRNLPEFYAAFGVKPGDGLFLPPEKRVRIW